MRCAATCLVLLSTLPLDGWAKLLDKPLGSTFEQISKAASTRQNLFRKEWTRDEPPIKACEL